MPATPAEFRQKWEERLAAPMFALALLFLIVLAGLIHRLPRPDVTDFEILLILGALEGLWLLFLPEALFRFLTRDRERGFWRPVGAAALTCLVPPLRMGVPSQSRPGHIWLPRLGWQPIDKHLRRALERAFSVPMICMALLVLPLLAAEFHWGDEIRQHPGMALALDIAVSAIWLAFAIEFILMVSVAESKLRYCAAHWIDLLVVLLPLVEALPILRALRLGRLLRLEQLTRMGRIYRLRGLAFKAWRAFLVLDLVKRVLNRHPQRRLASLEELLRAKEEEIVQLRREIAEVKEEIAKKNAALETTPEPVIVGAIAGEPPA